MKNAVERKTGQLAEHAKLFQAIFEQAAIGVALVSTSSGKFLKINKKYCDIVGYSEEEMLNMDFQSITYLEDRKSDFEIVELLKSGKIREFSKEKRYIRKNGDIVWVNGTVSPLWDPGKQPSYHITVVQDITQRKRVEEKLKDATLKAQSEKNKSEAIISALGDGIIIQDTDYNIVYQNKIQTEIYGEHDGELCYKVYEGRDTICKDCPVERTFSDGKIHRTERAVPIGSGISYFDLISSPLRDPEGNIIAGVKIIRDITEKRQAEEEVRSTKDRLQFLLSSSPAVIYTCKAFGDFGATYISENVTKLLGYRSSDFTENPFFWQDRIHPDDKERVISNLESIIESEHQILEYRFLDKDGVYRWMRDELTLIRDENDKPLEIAGYWIDITKSKQMEEKLRKSEQSLKCIFDNSLDGILVTDLETKKFIMGNRMINEMLGLDKEEIRNLSVMDIHPENDLPYVIEQFEKQARKELQLAKDIPVKRKDGSIFYADINASIITIVDKKYLLGLFRDITERKSAEEERINLMAKEQSARAEAETAKKLEKLKSIFIASTSHELRTPLNSIIGFTGILLQGWSGELNKEQKEYLEMINSSSKHLLELIIDILDISKIESGSIDLKVSVFDLREVVDEAITTLRASIKEKGLDMSVEMEDISMRSDRTRLLQCIMNLIGNSVKYTEKGSIKISANIIENKVDISVTDTGIGIKTEDIPRLFAPFVRLESPLTLKTSGTGLGLYLTKKLARDVLGGEIDVISKYGKGSTFTIQIPVEVETTGRIIKNKEDI